MDLKEYIVTLHNREDLEDFYDDMETPGGSLYIPDRSVDLHLRRTISRNTHYMLTAEEAKEIRKDERVRAVTLAEFINNLKQVDYGYSADGTYERTSGNATANLQWGILRHTIRDNVVNWGWDGTTTASSNFNITASGKNVDVLVFDGFIEINHPEFAVNADGTGGTRVTQFNWFSLTAQLGYGTNGTYDYTHRPEDSSSSNHGTSVASVIAGNRLGWARDANIFNFRSYTGATPNYNADGGNRLTQANSWDYIREWHNTKAVNSETGRRNPTVVNASFGPTTEEADTTSSYDGIAAISYRGAYFAPGRVLTDGELTARGVAVYNGDWYMQPGINEEDNNAYFDAIEADIEDAFDDGIILICAAGNGFTRLVKPANQDYNNVAFLQDLGGGAISDGIYPNRAGGSANGQTVPETISVGNSSYHVNDRRRIDSNQGDRIDLWAAGTAIQAAVRTSGTFNDPRNASYEIQKRYGTSFASPQVAGVIALLLESNQGLTQTEAKEWLISNASTNKMFDSGASDMSDFTSLQGAPNLLLYWENQRPESGTTVPKLNSKARPTSGRAWPRPRIRAKG
jgi:hypothetical protein